MGFLPFCLSVYVAFVFASLHFPGDRNEDLSLTETECKEKEQGDLWLLACKLKIGY